MPVGLLLVSAATGTRRAEGSRTQSRSREVRNSRDSTNEGTHVRLSTALFTLSAVCVCLPLWAQDEPPPRKVSMTISPLHLLNPELHVTGELRLAPRMSTAASLGVGRIAEERQTYRIWEVGGQLRFSSLGPSHTA